MADFINTVDVLGDSVVLEMLVDGTITEFKDNNITKIGTSAFNSCTALETVELPNATVINNRAFYGCASLKAITPEMLPKLKTIEYLYEGGLFEKCGLETVDWPALELCKDSFLFASCTSLVSVSLPNLVAFDYYANQSFQECTALTNVNMPKLQKILGGTFRRCTALKRVTLPSLTNVAGDSNFRECTALEVVDLPVCASFGNSNYQFNGATSLKALILRSTTVCTIGTVNNTFTNTPVANGVGHVYVPRELLTQYASATNWSTLGSSIFRALEDYTVDGTITGALDEDKI